MKTDYNKKVRESPKIKEKLMMKGNTYTRQQGTHKDSKFLQIFVTLL